MAETGLLIAQVYTGRMAIPIENVSVTITNDEKELIAYRTTNMSGRTEPVEIETPDISLSLAPSNQKAYATCDIQLDHPRYYSARIEHVQVFPGRESIQQMEMVPLGEIPPEDKTRTFAITPQDL